MRKQSAIAAIDALNGSWQSELPSQNLVWRHYFGGEYYARIIAVDLSKSSVRGCQLEFLADLQGLHTLTLSGSDVTDLGITELAGCTDLEVIDVSNTTVSDSAIIRLGRLPRLKMIKAHGTAVTTTAVARLEELGIELDID